MYQLKYRRLSIEELSYFEKDFIQFLVINGISAEDWLKIKDENSAQTNEMIESFSDTIFEGMMQKTSFFEYLSPKILLSYNVEGKKAICYILEVTGGKDLNFDVENPEASISEADPEDFTFTIATRQIEGDRNIFIFQELSKGCLVSDGKLFKFLSTFK